MSKSGHSRSLFSANTDNMPIWTSIENFLFTGAPCLEFGVDYDEKKNQPLHTLTMTFEEGSDSCYQKCTEYDDCKYFTVLYGNKTTRFCDLFSKVNRSLIKTGLHNRSISGTIDCSGECFVNYNDTKIVATIVTILSHTY